MQTSTLHPPLPQPPSVVVRNVHLVVHVLYRLFLLIRYSPCSIGFVVGTRKILNTFFALVEYLTQLPQTTALTETDLIRIATVMPPMPPLPPELPTTPPLRQPLPTQLGRPPSYARQKSRPVSRHRYCICTHVSASNIRHTEIDSACPPSTLYIILIVILAALTTLLCSYQPLCSYCTALPYRLRRRRGTRLWRV